MVGNISTNTSIMASQQTTSQSNSNGLTTEQQETLTKVLSEFDSSNLSESDAQSIVNSFKEAGIEPSSALAEAMEAEGFDAKEVGDLAGGPRGSGGMPPPPPPNQEEEESTISSLLDTLLSLEDEEDDSSATTSFDEVSEYTSRILNLNESSKSEVMDLLDKFSSDETNYSDEEKSNILKNSLTSILGDNDNYNRVSFYA